MNVDSGSWIYILLSVLFLVLSAVGNKKKKVTTSTEPFNEEEEYETSASPSERNWPRNFEDVLNDVLDLPKNQEVSTGRQQPMSRNVMTDHPYHSYERIEDEAQSLESIDEEVFSYETPVTKKDDKPIYQSITMTEENKPAVEEEHEAIIADFDLRQGIIYAEILNRKYF